jgi:tight adherence protein C
MTIIIAIIIGGCAFASYLFIDRVMTQREHRELTRQRIYESSGGGSGADTSGVSFEAQALFGASGEKSTLALNAEEALLKLGVDIHQAESKLGRRLLHAGIGSPNAVIFYLAFQRFIAPVLVILGVVLLLGARNSDSQLLDGLMGVLLLVIGIFGPKLYIENLTQKRRKKLLNGFPDMLDLMLVCVESGLALDSALNRVTAELGRVHPEITAELNRARIELSLLNNRSQALQNLAERTNLIPYRFLTAALIQSERFGTALTDTLRVMADEYRTKRMLLAEEKAARLPALMTVPLIFCLLPSFMLIVLGPAIISFMRSAVF